MLYIAQTNVFLDSHYQMDFVKDSKMDQKLAIHNLPLRSKHLSMRLMYHLVALVDNSQKYNRLQMDMDCTDIWHHLPQLQYPQYRLMSVLNCMLVGTLFLSQSLNYVHFPTKATRVTRKLVKYWEILSAVCDKEDRVSHVIFSIKDRNSG